MRSWKSCKDTVLCGLGKGKDETLFLFYILSSDLTIERCKYFSEEELF